VPDRYKGTYIKPDLSAKAMWLQFFVAAAAERFFKDLVTRSKKMRKFYIVRVLLRCERLAGAE
jgi:hypothetical protein